MFFEKEVGILLHDILREYYVMLCIFQNSLKLPCFLWEIGILEGHSGVISQEGLVASALHAQCFSVQTQSVHTMKDIGWVILIPDWLTFVAAISHDMSMELSEATRLASDLDHPVCLQQNSFYIIQYTYWLCAAVCGFTIHSLVYYVMSYFAHDLVLNCLVLHLIQWYSQNEIMSRYIYCTLCPSGLCQWTCMSGPELAAQWLWYACARKTL